MHDELNVKVTRSARKHRIGVAHIMAALEGAEPELDEGDRRLYIVTDDRGVELEIVMVSDGRDDTWAIIHVIPTSFEHRGE